MYMRIVQVKYKPDALSEIRQIFDEKIIPLLQKMPGCLFVCIVKSDPDPDEAVCMSLWDSQVHAQEYERSGLFNEFLEELRPHLADSSEWKIQLSKDMTLEYQPVPEEPVVKAYTSLARTSAEIPARDEAQMMYLRIVSVRIQTGKMEEFRNLYTKEIIPALRAVKGCRYAFLTESIKEKNDAISVTIWDSRQDADSYERGGLFTELTEKVKHTFAELYQWKMALGKKYGGEVVTSEDLTVRYYSIVTGKSFQ